MNNDLISREALKKALQNREECKECTDEEKVDLNEVKAIAEEAEQERQQGDLISRSALLKAMEEERQYLLARGQTGAEHILVHHCLPIIDNAPTVEACSIIDGLNNEIDDLSENLAWYINERNRLLKERRPQGEYVDISKLRLMTVEECAGHTIDYAMGWKACIEWIKKGGAV